MTKRSPARTVVPSERPHQAASCAGPGRCALAGLHERRQLHGHRHDRGRRADRALRARLLRARAAPRVGPAGLPTDQVRTVHGRHRESLGRLGEAMSPSQGIDSGAQKGPSVEGATEGCRGIAVQRAPALASSSLMSAADQVRRRPGTGVVVVANADSRLVGGPGAGAVAVRATIRLQARQIAASSESEVHHARVGRPHRSHSRVPIASWWRRPKVIMR